MAHEMLASTSDKCVRPTVCAYLCTNGHVIGCDCVSVLKTKKEMILFFSNDYLFFCWTVAEGNGKRNGKPERCGSGCTR